MTGAAMCWHDQGESRSCPQCQARDYIRDKLIAYGRCRSGRQWFWTATEHGGEREDG